MIISWRCQQCGWMNDNNPNDCRRCAGNTEFIGNKELVSKLANKTKIETFDALLKAKRSNQDGGQYDER